MTNKNDTNSNLNQFTNQRWLLSDFKDGETLAGQFLELDKFLRKFPNIQLETNEYLVTMLDQKPVLARRITGFLDQLPDQFRLRDWQCRDLSESESSWDKLGEFLDSPSEPKGKQLEVFIVTGQNNGENQFGMSVQKRVIEAI
jgi:hypothetical protein